MVKINELFDLNETIAKEIFSGKEFPWEVLPCIKAFIIELGGKLPKDKFDEIKEKPLYLVYRGFCNSK